MAIYIGLLIYIFAIGYLFRYKYKNRKYFLTLAFAAMALVVGLRGKNVGEDTNMYLNIATAAKRMSWSQILAGFPNTTWSYDQWGFPNKINTPFLLFNKLVVSIFQNPQWVLFWCAVITCVGFAKFIYDNTYQVFSATLVFMCDSIFMMSFNLMRQCFVMAIALQAYKCYLDKKYIKGSIYILIAALIHNTALIYLLMIPLLIIKDKKKEIKYILLIAVLSPILLQYLQQLVARFSPYYAGYFQQSFWSGSLGGTLLLWLFIIVFGAYSYVFIKKKADNEQYLLIALIIIYLSLEIASLRATMVSRLALYYRAFLILYFPSIYERLGKDRKIFRVLLYVLLVFEFMSYARSGTRVYSFFWQA